MWTHSIFGAKIYKLFKVRVTAQYITSYHNLFACCYRTHITASCTTLMCKATRPEPVLQEKTKKMADECLSYRCCQKFTVNTQLKSVYQQSRLQGTLLCRTHHFFPQWLPKPSPVPTHTEGWPGWVAWINIGKVDPPKVTNVSTNRARCSLTLFMLPTPPNQPPPTAKCTCYLP